MERINRFIRCLFLILPLVFSSGAFAQAEGKGKSTLSGPRKQLATIVFAGLAGAVLGLSTLSFYGRPQEKLVNIAIGLGVGIIIGTGYTTYKAATQPRDFYGWKQKADPEWPALTEPLATPGAMTPRLGYSWNY